MLSAVEIVTDKIDPELACTKFFNSRSGLSWQYFIPYYAVGHVRVTRWLNVH